MRWQRWHVYQVSDESPRITLAGSVSSFTEAPPRRAGQPALADRGASLASDARGQRCTRDRARRRNDQLSPRAVRRHRRACSRRGSAILTLGMSLLSDASEDGGCSWTVSWTGVHSGQLTYACTRGHCWVAATFIHVCLAKGTSPQPRPAPAGCRNPAISRRAMARSMNCRHLWKFRAVGGASNRRERNKDTGAAMTNRLCKAGLMGS
jgi:hypothetical protein